MSCLNLLNFIPSAIFVCVCRYTYKSVTEFEEIINVSKKYKNIIIDNHGNNYKTCSTFKYILGNNNSGKFELGCTYKISGYGTRYKFLNINPLICKSQEVFIIRPVSKYCIDTI